MEDYATTEGRTPAQEISQVKNEIELNEVDIQKASEIEIELPDQIDE